MRIIILSPRNCVERRSYLDVASQRSHIAFPHRWSSIGIYSNHFYPYLFAAWRFPKGYRKGGPPGVCPTQ